MLENRGRNDSSISAIQPVPDTAAAISFLKVMLPNDRWDLGASFENGTLTTRTFEPGDVDGAFTFISSRQFKANEFWTVNQPFAGVRNKKPTAKDIEFARFIHVDIDDPSDDVLTRLRTFVPRPSMIIFSGGGYQAFWKLKVPTTDLDKVVAINRAIAQQLGGDPSVHNIDRMMRLPGTINLPNQAKRDRGRVPALAYVVPEVA